MNKWDAKFGFFWYNDDEIFRFTKEDFDKKASDMAAAGINIVMTFSCTHFRWSMKPYWKLINRCLTNVVEACHNNDIKVVEHHSSHLSWDPLDEEDWKRPERTLRKRMSSMASWEGFEEYIKPDTIKGTEEYRQIDGRTGDYARSRYHGYCKCFNNVEYRKAYFDYLEKLYKETNVDGIMTDDVQFFGDGHACACSYCRKLFKEQYDYDLPLPADGWDEFYGDYDNPVFIAWQRFKRDSTKRFQDDVNAHFKSLGLDLLRPNYQSSCVGNNWTAYPFEKAAHIWDWVFQENCFSFVIKHSWPQFLTESRHRFNMGRLKGIPSMSMFYPDRFDSFYFSWALCMAWGQMFTATPEGEDMSSTEKVFRDFEKKHSDILMEQKKKADVTIYWSYETANYCNPEVCNHITAVRSWSQALTFAGYSSDMVFASEDSIHNSVHSCLIVPDVMMMSDSEYKKINNFAKNGGTVIYTGRPGAKKPDGTYRTPEEMHERLEIPDQPLIDMWPVDFEIGKGRVVVHGLTGLDNDYYEPFSVDRWVGTDDKKELPEYKADSMAMKVENLLSEYTGKLVETIPADPLVNTYYMYDKRGDNLLIHIINAEGTINSRSGEEGHSAIIPCFTKDTDSFSTTISLDMTGVDKAYLLSVEMDSEEELKVSKSGKKTIIDIPEGYFTGYGLVRIPLDAK